ncbi:MAG: MBL fold metallo-hydrolase [Promethearchaeota archaeon]
MVNIKITAFGGVNEIGGNQFLLERNSKLFLDFGISFSTQRKYFEFPTLVPKNIIDLLNCNLIPNLSGLYRDIGIEPTYDEQNLLAGVSLNIEKEDNYAGILISHAHTDHCGFINLVRDYIPIYLSHISRRLIELKEETGISNWKGKSSLINLNTLDFSSELNLKEYNIMSFPVDHSLPGATAFLININGKNIAYTGDFRFHGKRGDISEKFKKALLNQEDGIEILFCEGTRVKPEKRNAGDVYTSSENLLESEQEVEKKFTEIVNNEEKLIIYDATYYDFNRLKTIWKATIKCGRTLILPSKQAYIVNELKNEDYGKDFPDINTLKVILSSNKGRLYKAEKELLKKYGLENINFESWVKYRKKWEVNLMENTLNEEQVFWKPNMEEILKNSNEYVVYVVNGPRFIKDLKKPSNDIIGTYIYGKAEAFDVETMIAFEKLENWVKMCNLDFKYAHSSGHLSEQMLVEFINEVSPKILIPIHTNAPERFKTILKNPSIKIKLLEKGKTENFTL